MPEERTKSQIGKSSRRKGQTNERELAAELSALLGLTIKRRVRNHLNESDLTGVPGWSVECKACKQLQLATWWKQTVRQADDSEYPVLFYKIPFKGFRAVVPLAVMGLGELLDDSLAMTAELSLDGFAMLYRETEASRMKYEQNVKNHAMTIGVKLQ